MRFISKRRLYLTPEQYSSVMILCYDRKLPLYTTNTPHPSVTGKIYVLLKEHHVTAGLMCPDYL